MAKASKNDKKATPITPDPVLPTGAEAEQTQPQPKLYPKIKLIAHKGTNDLEEDVNKWIKESDAEIKNLRVFTVPEALVCEIIYVETPEPTPRPVEG